MDNGRRQALRTGGGAGLVALLVAAGFLKPGEALADWNKPAFGATTVADVLKGLGGTASAASKDVMMTAPDIAENGAVVPVQVTSMLPKTESIAILVEKNPNTLAAVFDIPAGTEPWVSTRIKMGQTSNVVALVKADGKFYTVTKEIKVTLGGCGG
ncbi:MAG: thiosulfate oxidation carrier protein SoxY [Proteobacteria bacterium]|nr:thiosulfate oxidation carrier protein SoxY [Pseudomonadota bacterium]